MFVLTLNPMTDRAEARELVARAETREAIEAFIAKEKVEPYSDSGPAGYGREGIASSHEYTKVFRKGGPLEWFNPPGPQDIVDIGTLQNRIDNAITRATREWNLMLIEIKNVV